MTMREEKKGRRQIDRKKDKDSNSLLEGAKKAEGTR